MITAVITVRGGSVRVKNKNIKPFAGSSLLEIKIEQLKNVKAIDKIIVSSDSDEMLALAIKKGVIAKKRPDKYCDEKSRTFNELVEYIASDVVQDGAILWAPCVCPLVDEESFKQAIDRYMDMKNGKIEADSIVSAKLIKEYIFDENGPVNFSIEYHVKSQLLPNWHVIINGFFLADAEVMRNKKFVYGNKPCLVEIEKDKAIDIDDENDFFYAEYLYNKKGERK